MSFEKEYFYTRERDEANDREGVEDKGPNTEEGIALRQLEAFEEYAERLARERGGDVDKLKEQVGVENSAEDDYTKKLKRLVEYVFSWIKLNGLTVLELRRLGGGFKNPVLLITTKEGKQFVAKAFVEEDSAIATDEAKKLLSELAEADKDIIPELITWLDEASIISEKAEGFAVRVVIEKVAKSEMESQKAEEAFRRLGELLGTLHSRTARHVNDTTEKSFAKLDTERLIKKHIDEAAIFFSEDLIARLKNKIASDFTLDNLSLIHGDAHLDNFFIDPNNSEVQIVDYDDLRLGDPNADLARAFASIESWLHAYDANERDAENIKKSFLDGYSSKRTLENIAEVNMLRLRLFVVQLRSFIASDFGKSLIDKAKSSNKNIGELLSDITPDLYSEKEMRAIKQTHFAYQEILEYMDENYKIAEDLIDDNTV